MGYIGVEIQYTSYQQYPMQNQFVPPSEQQLIQQYNQLKQILLNQSKQQMNSAFKINSQMTKLFQNIVDLFNILTAKIAALKQQNIELRANSMKKTKNHQFFDKLQDSFQIDDKSNEDIFNPQLIKRANKINKYEINNDDKQQSRQQNSQQIKFQEDSHRIQNSLINRIKYEPFALADQENQGKLDNLAKKKNSLKRQERLLLKRQFAAISKYVKDYLAPTFVYDKDHKKYMIPKKHILHEYFRWCNVNKRDVLQNKASIIQMRLTNQLKALFPLMDSYTKNYRGLRKRSHSNSNYSNEQFIDRNQQKIHDLN